MSSSGLDDLILIMKGNKMSIETLRQQQMIFDAGQFLQKHLSPDLAKQLDELVPKENREPILHLVMQAIRYGRLVEKRDGDGIPPEHELEEATDVAVPHVQKIYVPGSNN